jgi:coproporphyrinogen III oxidase
MTTNGASSTQPGTTRERVVALLGEAHDMICAAFEQMDGQAHFASERWERPGGGGGEARVLADGPVFERGGVNVSAVHGEQAPPSILNHLPASAGIAPGSTLPYFATGLSMVFHPRNPYVPAFHANYRYFELGAGDYWFFGGGMDMTPCYGFEEDAAHFHHTLKTYCDAHDPGFYAAFKPECDRYFFLKHRGEMRGVGGIFFDNLHPEGPEGWEQGFAFMRDGLATIPRAYLPVVERRKATPYGERERQWQLYRRGRYVEFNLVYDRGTIFGLQTNGNIEAILMSLPPLVRWEFNYRPEPGSPEAALARFLEPQDWAAKALQLLDSTAESR